MLELSLVKVQHIMQAPNRRITIPGAQRVVYCAEGSPRTPRLPLESAVESKP